MKKLDSTLVEYCSLIAGIASAIAVVVSVIYLAHQVHDNTKLLRSQSHYNALWLGQRPLELLVMDAGLTKIVNACYARPDDQTQDDWTRCSNFMFMQFNSWEYFYYEYAEDSIPKQVWVGADAYFKELIATKPGLARYWKENAMAFDQPFRGYVQQEFAKRGNRPAP